MSDLPYTQIECKKDALRQMQTGEWKISLTVQHADMPAELLSAPMGQRMIAVLIALRGDEEPKPGEIFGETGYTKGSGPKDKTAPKSEGERARFRAVKLCENPAFLEWIDTGQARGKWATPPVYEAERMKYGLEVAYCRQFILDTCGISSRRDLAVNPEALERFLSLEMEYRHRDSRR